MKRTAFFSIALILGLAPLQAQGRDQASMGALMGRLTPQYVQDIAKNDAALQALLIETFEGDWSKAKECLLFDHWPLPGKAPEHAASLLLMGELVRMRSVVCNGVAKATQQNILLELQKVHLESMDPAFRMEVSMGTPEQHFNPFTPTGAEKLTSDIDVASGGLNTELAVRLFNQAFRQQLGVNWDPATVFDYNVYAADWIFPKNFIEVVRGNTTDTTPRPEHVLATDAGTDPREDVRLQAERSQILTKAGLLHIRRNCSPTEWAGYSQLRVSETPLLQSVNDQFSAFSAEIQLKRAQLKPALPKPTSLWPDSYYNEAVETRARNQLYQERLLKVKALRLRYKMLKEKAQKTPADQQELFTLAKQTTEALADALFFANEVYATEGATLHAVQGIQKVEKARVEGRILVVHLTQSQYVQSFHENVGDSLHSLSHYESTPAYAAYRAGKYIERMLLAGGILTREVANNASYPLLKGLADRAAAVKASPDGDDPVKIAALFSNYRTASDLIPLRSAILTFGADIAGKLR